MKYYSRSELYKSSNVTINARNFEARSYEWWILGKQIGKHYVLNIYPYSNSTIKHRHKVQRKLAELGVKPDLVLSCPKGLQDLQSGVDYYNGRIAELQALIDKPRSRKDANVERAITIGGFHMCIKQLKALMKGGRK